jgi:hypothetical protein
VVVLGFLVLFYLKNRQPTSLQPLGSFGRKQGCVGHTQFLDRIRRGKPVAIDLTQQSHRGVSFLMGRDLREVIYRESWGRFEHMGSYVSAPNGDMYITPMPYITISQNTFALQKNIYRLDAQSGRLNIWMRLEDVHASSSNPYGVMAIEYDCDDDSLWVSAIDESDYHTQKGVIYHIDIATKKIIQRLEGIDALSLKLLHTESGKYLLYGSARESSLCALSIQKGRLSKSSQKLFALSDANEHIRKIVVRKKDHLELQTIPFSYSLITQTSEQGVRSHHLLSYNKTNNSWELKIKR